MSFCFINKISVSVKTKRIYNKLGDGVEGFKVGDRVAGEAHVGCGKCNNCKQGHYTVCLNYGHDGHDGGLDMGHRHYGFYWQGANAEYNVYKTSSLHLIPENVSYDVASMCDCAGVAFHGVQLEDRGSCDHCHIS